MTTARDGSEHSGLAVEIEHEFTATPERVYRRWVEADALARWFSPPGYTTVQAEVDPRPGGAWRLDFRSLDGRHEYGEHGTFRELVPYERLVLTLTQRDGGRANPRTLVSVQLEDIGTAGSPRTLMRFVQSGYRTAGPRDDNADGWRGCFTFLGDDIDADAAEEPLEQSRRTREIRELFAKWFDDSSRKDLDAQMEPIAADVVSYEHGVPQEYRGVDAVRAVCAEGLEYQAGDFRWDIPDLQVRVTGDVAVTWGLNRMRNTAPDGTVREEWSRGTRVFERRGGRWQMIHQHVSFPVDDEGRASTAHD